MNDLNSNYDPHLLYLAINLTVELMYKIPMQTIYKLLETAKENVQDKITSKDIENMLKTLATNFEKGLVDEDVLIEGEDLKAKIKDILHLLGCDLPNEQLNLIIQGELSLEEALSKQAIVAWNLLFKKNKKGHYQPNQDIANELTYSTIMLTQNSIETQIKSNMEKQYQQNQIKRNQLLDTHQLSRRATISLEDPILLEQKRVKLKLYLAHMQGYDRDRDGDGSRGIDLTTGEIIDIGDIYIADKEHGCVIEDIDHDGIDISDIH